jgi:hypothetical protein
VAEQTSRAFDCNGCKTRTIVDGASNATAADLAPAPPTEAQVAALRAQDQVEARRNIVHGSIAIGGGVVLLLGVLIASGKIMLWPAIAIAYGGIQLGRGLAKRA